MTIDELISRLEELRDECGNEQIKVYSDIYFLDIHKIDEVRYNNDRSRYEIIIS